MSPRSIVILAALAAGPAAAEAAICSVSSVSPVVFGAYDRFDSSPVDSTGSITFVCSGVGGSDTVQVSIDRGAAGTFAPRTLVSGIYALAYNLYLDAARNAVWGDGTGGTATYGPITAVEGSTSITIFGRVPAGQDVAAGAYADTLTVTLQF